MSSNVVVVLGIVEDIMARVIGLREAAAKDIGKRLPKRTNVEAGRCIKGNIVDLGS